MTIQGNRCSMAERFLERYTAGTLSPEEEREFRRHYATCDVCLESVCREDPSAVFAGLRFHEPAVREPVWSEIEARLARKRAWATFEWSPRFAVAALGLIFVISLGLYVFRSHKVPPGSGGQADLLNTVLLHKHLSNAANLLKPDVSMIDYDDQANKIKFTMIYDKGLKDVN